MAKYHIEPAMPKLKHYDHWGTARFITFPTYGRQPILVDESVCEIIGTEIARLRSDHQIKLLGYVIMPEHMHLVLLPPDGLSLGRIIGQLKGRSARRFGQMSECSRSLDGECGIERVWQYRCYDHNCRSPLATSEKINYCHMNPVMRGLVSEPGQWRWSSYNWYQGLRDVPLEIDGIEAP
jgi:putative transposase